MRRVFLFLLAAAAAFPAAGQSVEIYDLLLKGGHVIDPANKRNGRMDIAISAGIIKKIAPSIPATHARRVADLSEYYVTPGLIDIYAHFDANGSPLGLNPDHNALRNGVTTAVDAGSGDPKNFAQFKLKGADQAETRVLAFVNIMGDGGKTPMTAEAAAALARKYPEMIVGFRAASPAAVDAAVKAAALSKTVVIAEPGTHAADVLSRLRPGDIFSHAYGRDGVTVAQAKEARHKGVLFDVGHGADGFWFRVAVPMVKQGFLPDTISTDLDKNSIMLPRATMTNVMSKFLAMGVPLDQVIERSTSLPAKAIHRPKLGMLEEGGVADIAVLELRKGPFGFLDSGHAKMTSDKELRCVLTVRNGKIVWDSEGLSLIHWKDAGPYSNYK